MNLFNLFSVLTVGSISGAPLVNNPVTDNYYVFYNQDSLSDIVSMGTYHYSANDYVIDSFIVAPNDYISSEFLLRCQYTIDIEVFFRGNSYIPQFSYDDFLFKINYFTIYFYAECIGANDGFIDYNCWTDYLGSDFPYINTYGTYNIGSFVDYRLCDYPTLRDLCSIQYEFSTDLGSNYRLMCRPLAFSHIPLVTPFVYIGCGNSQGNEWYNVYNVSIGSTPLDNLFLYNVLFVDNITNTLYSMLDYYKDSINQIQNSYDSGYETGFHLGSQVGFGQGYDYGFSEGFNADSVAVSVFGGILEIGLIPIDFFLSIFNFEILGINLTAFITSILSIMVVIIMMRTIFNGGSN